jgi:hypothetical protein
LLTSAGSASIATIARIPYAKGILDNPDYLYTFTDLGIWTTVEIGVALTASNLATLKPLLRKMRIFNTMSGMANYASKGQQPGSGVNGPMPSNGNRVIITGASSVRGARWHRKESMELQLVERRVEISYESRSDLEKGVEETHSREAWLQV